MNPRLIQMLLASLLSLLLLSCSDQDEPLPDRKSVITPNVPMTTREIDKNIQKYLDQNLIYDWKNASDYMLWSAASHGEYVFTIGFGKTASDFDRSTFPAHQQLQNELMLKIAQLEGRPLQDILLQSEPYLSQIDVVIRNQETVSAIRPLGYIRYMEPAAYVFRTDLAQQREASSSSGSGCGFNAVVLSAADYTIAPPNVKIPWSFSNVQIPAAWNASTGAGVTIGVIDTGVSSQQVLLGSSFSDGYSTNRSISKFGFYVDSTWPWATATDGSADLCGHGTSMVSTIGAPRNDDGLPVGVAYNANVISCRAAANVVIDGYQEQNGVKNAFTYLANLPSVRIISMSMGHVISVGKIADAIKYAYSKNKLVFSAAGTSTTYTNFVGVIFPATMPEVLAVTGVREGSPLQGCSVCHTGSKVEFTTPMERTLSGNTVPVNSYYNGNADYVGGSSVATATVAGIAALVWSKYPGWSRSQVVNRLRTSGSFYPVKNGQLGYGNINAATAVQ